MNLRIGTGLPNIQKKDLESFLVPVLSIEKQLEIARIFDALSSKIHLEKDILNFEYKRKKYLLSNLFI